jgi:hypothetical protein
MSDTGSMRRLDFFTITFGLLLIGPLFYGAALALGVKAQTAGIWAATFFVVIILGWIFSYVFRVFSTNMTFNKQIQLMKGSTELYRQYLKEKGVDPDSKKAEAPEIKGGFSDWLAARSKNLP